MLPSINMASNLVNGFPLHAGYGLTLGIHFAKTTRHINNPVRPGGPGSQLSKPPGLIYRLFIFVNSWKSYH